MSTFVGQVDWRVARLNMTAKRSSVQTLRVCDEGSLEWIRDLDSSSAAGLFAWFPPEGDACCLSISRCFSSLSGLDFVDHCVIKVRELCEPAAYRVLLQSRPVHY